MKINIFEFLNMRGALESFFSQKTNLALSYKLRKIMRVLNEEYRDLYASMEGKEDKEIEEWAKNNEIEIAIEKISLQELLKSDIIISPIELEFLDWLFEEEENEQTA